MAHKPAKMRRMPFDTAGHARPALVYGFKPEAWGASCTPDSGEPEYSVRPGSPPYQSWKASTNSSPMTVISSTGLANWAVLPHADSS